MRILVFGKDGQVGAALPLHLMPFGETIAVGRRECDLRDAAAVRRTIAEAEPDVIVNAAAYTAVDRAETDRESCFAVNAEAPGVMAAAAASRGALLLHYSTDYVFDGRKTTPYAEEDETGPLGVYGASKLAGEKAVSAAGGTYAVLRTSWVYGNHGANFMKTMLRLGADRPELRIVADQHGAPTSAESIAAGTARLLSFAEHFPSGVYHMTAAGQTTWFGFATAIFAEAAGERKPALTPISTAEYPTPAARPANSVLSNDKFERTFGFRLAEWRAALREVLRARAAEETPVTLPMEP